MKANVVHNRDGVRLLAISNRRCILQNQRMKFLVIKKLQIQTEQKRFYLPYI